MTLYVYVPEAARYEPASERDILSASSRILASRRKSSGQSPKLTQAQRFRIRHLAARGKPKPEIAAKFGVTRQTVYRVLRETEAYEETP